jgi:hypothetical protein
MLKGLFYLSILAAGAYAWIHPDFVASVTKVAEAKLPVAVIAAVEPPPKFKIWTAGGGGELHIQSLDDRDLTITKVLLNNKEVETGWEAHEIRPKNDLYERPPVHVNCAPDVHGDTHWCEKGPMGEKMASDYAYNLKRYQSLPDSHKQEFLTPVMTPDRPHFALGDERVIVILFQNVVKVEIATDHGSSSYMLH